MLHASTCSKTWPLRAVRVVALLALPALFSGCTDSPPARFRLNMVAMEQSDVYLKQQQEIANILTAMFGTPDNPVALPQTGLDIQKLRMAAGPVRSDERGNQTGLFRRHCAHCHGVTGDGAGPTAAFLNPYPRDYRQGKYKFKSTERPAEPTHDDLARVLFDGVPGTAMPSFKLLPAHQRGALVEYIVYLSMRGMMELQLIAAVDDLSETDTVDAEGRPELESLDTSPGFLVEELLVGGVVQRWQEARDRIIRPDPAKAPPADRTADEIAASAHAGQKLFFGPKANCIKCHGVGALGDGQTNDYDDWNKGLKKLVDEHPGLTPAELGALPIRTIRPRNLRQGVYRGGRRPLDLFWRLYAGVNGAPMPGLGPASAGQKGTLSEEEMWQIVDYVQSLPFEPASQPPESPASFSRERL